MWSCVCVFVYIGVVCPSKVCHAHICTEYASFSSSCAVWLTVILCSDSIFSCVSTTVIVFSRPRRAASWFHTAICLSLKPRIDRTGAIINLLIKGRENKNLSNPSRFPQVYISSLAKIFYYGRHHCLEGSDLSNVDLFLASYSFDYCPYSPEAAEVGFTSRHASIFRKLSSPPLSSAVLGLRALLWPTRSCSF